MCEIPKHAFFKKRIVYNLGHLNMCLKNKNHEFPTMIMKKQNKPCFAVSCFLFHI